MIEFPIEAERKTYVKLVNLRNVLGEVLVDPACQFDPEINGMLHTLHNVMVNALAKEEGK